MAGAAADGCGATAIFGTSAYGPALKTINWDGIKREVIESTHMGTTTARTYIPAQLYDGGEVTLEAYHNGTDRPDTAIATAAETPTVTWESGKTWAASVLLTEFGASAGIGEAQTQSIKAKVTGAVTVTP